MSYHIFTKMKETLYIKILQRVAEGARFKVDFENRSLKLDGKYVIKNGEYDGELCGPWGEPIGEIERLYERYRHSVPSERTESKRRNYFRALPEKELSTEDMMYGELRENAQIELELFVLSQILYGTLKWDEFAKGKWFWQSSNIPSLILLKKWIEPKTENNNK